MNFENLGDALGEIERRGVVLSVERDAAGTPQLRIIGLKLLTPGEVDGLREHKAELITYLSAAATPPDQQTYDQWLAVGGGDLRFSLGGITLLLTCDPDRYAQVQREAETCRARGQQVGTTAVPAPLSPLEYEALLTLHLEAQVDEEMARRGLGDTVEVEQDGRVEVRRVGEGALARALRQQAFALQVKCELGGRIEACGRGAVAQLRAVEDQERAVWEQERARDQARRSGWQQPAASPQRRRRAA